jgi:uncharacterized protein (TIGR02598 family)
MVSQKDCSFFEIKPLPMPDSPPHSNTAGRKRPQSRRQAFSLVEVVIAMGIFSFAIIATFSLIGQSFKSYSSAINDTVSRQIMNQLAANVQQARLSDLTTTPSYTLNFDNEGNPVPSSDTMSVYTANVTFTQATTPFGSTNLYAVNIKVSPKNTNDAQQTTLIVCPQN